MPKASKSTETATPTDKKKVTRRFLSHEGFAKLLLWAKENQVELQNSTDKGKSVDDIANEHSVSPSSIKSVFDILGITYGRKADKSNGTPSLLFTNLVIVVARLAHQLNVPYDEIKPYVPADVNLNGK